MAGKVSIRDVKYEDRTLIKVSTCGFNDAGEVELLSTRQQRAATNRPSATRLLDKLAAAEEGLPPKPQPRLRGRPPGGQASAGAARQGDDDDEHVAGGEDEASELQEEVGRMAEEIADASDSDPLPSDSDRSDAEGPCHGEAEAGAQPAGCDRPDPAAPLQAAGAINERRRAAKDLVADYIVQIMDDPNFAISHPRVIIAEALSQIDRAGLRFWGSFPGSLYTRRRTVVDAVLSVWEEAS